MVELAEILHRHGWEYREEFGSRMPPQHGRAMDAIGRCRTPALGGHLHLCSQCDQTAYLYHSCRNRHCPKCGQNDAQQWLEKQSSLLLPVPSFLVTFTVPEQLRSVLRSHQKNLYGLLFRCAAASLQKLAWDTRHVGGMLGMIGVLHTWTRLLHYHPHIHMLVTGGGISKDGKRWNVARKNYLVPKRALSKIFRAKFRDELRKTELFEEVPAHVWRKAWVVHIKAVGSGETALKYLAPYVFRTAISNNRIVSLNAGRVTFRYQESGSTDWKLCTLEVKEFLRRFLQHVLPWGFQKVRCYGLFHHSRRNTLHAVRLMLASCRSFRTVEQDETDSREERQKRRPRCQGCGAMMIVLIWIMPLKRGPPR